MSDRSIGPLLGSKEMTDEELMRLYRDKGDEGAFNALYQRHSGRVYAYLSSRVTENQAVDELLQTVFMKFHRSRYLYDKRYAVLQWLFVISRTTLIDYQRAAKRSVPIVEEIEIGDIASSPIVEGPLDSEALSGLSEKDRMLVQWRVLDELSYEQISKKLGQSEPALRQALSRALKRLRILIEAKGSLQ